MHTFIHAYRYSTQCTVLRFNMTLCSKLFPLQHDSVLCSNLFPLHIITYLQAYIRTYFRTYIQVQRISHSLWIQGDPVSKMLALSLQSRSSEVFGVDAHPGAVLSHAICLDHATGVSLSRALFACMHAYIWSCCVRYAYWGQLPLSWSYRRLQLGYHRLTTHTHTLTNTYIHTYIHAHILMRAFSGCDW
jgi:hypothetical protein